MKDQRPDGRDVERVRELLNEAAPQDTRASYRAESVVRRGRRARTSRGVVSALAVGVAAAAVIIGPSLIDSSPVTNEATDPSNGVATRPSDPPAGSHLNPYANPCPDSPIEIRSASDPVLELQPTDVIVRLCRAGAAGEVSAWDPPADALVSDVDGFAAKVAELPAAPVDYCPTARPAPQPFALQVTDEAGETETLTSLLTTCGTVTVNSKRVSTEGLLEVFRLALTAQRATLQPQVADTTMQCLVASPHVHPGWMSEVTAQTRFIAAITCPPWRHPLVRGEVLLATRASDAAIDLLNQEWAAHARDLRTHQPLDYDLCSAAAVVSGTTYVMTTWGDVVPMRMVMCGNARIGQFQLLASKALLDELSLPYLSGVHTTIPGD